MKLVKIEYKVSILLSKIAIKCVFNELKKEEKEVVANLHKTLKE